MPLTESQRWLRVGCAVAKALSRTHDKRTVRSLASIGMMTTRYSMMATAREQREEAKEYAGGSAALTRKANKLARR